MEDWIRLFALGQDFDVDEFLRRTRLEPAQVWRRGEPRGCFGAVNPTSGVAFKLGDARAIPFPSQAQIAIDFVSANRSELAALGRFPGVTFFTLGLQKSIEVRDELSGFAMPVPRELMDSLLAIGCELTHYVALDHPVREDGP
ncbi:hypothetical protein [Silanimonas sp.]|jgi:hypothetical protein|uniref:hypothetical protein n=1 Tax=Silanimonas sp. TaxID=1929290 RepID=UPI0037C8E239